MKLVELTNGSLAQVDDSDFDRVTSLKWYEKKGRRTTYAESTTKPYVRMHRFIMQVDGDIDHKDRNGLNNTRSNLREVSKDQNSKNLPKYNNNQCNIKGVHFARDRVRPKPWRAMISVNGKNKSLGYHATAEEAGRAYDKAAKEIFGAFCGELNYE